MSLVKNLLLYLSLFLSFIYCIFGFIKPLSLEQDLGRHLLFGKIMVETQQIIKVNLLSFTYPDFKYVNSHWLSEVIFYLINSLFGPLGLIVLTAVILIITALILFRFTHKRVAISALVITFPIYLSFLIFRTDVRPEIFSYLFTAIFTTVLFQFREKRTKLIYLLIPISLFWVNLHIYFAVGLGLIFLFIAEDFILNKFKLNKKNKELLTIFILSLASVFINPNFIEGVIFPFAVFNNYGIDIQENLNLYSLAKLYNAFSLLPHVLFILILLVLSFIYRKKLLLIEIILVLLFSIFAFLVFRNFYILIIVSFYTLTRLVSFILFDIEKVLKKLVTPLQLNILKSLSYFFLCLIILALIFMSYSTSQGISLKATERGKLAVDFFINNNLKGPIYNSFDFGQYLAYRFYPEQKIYVDARPEAYPKEFLKDTYVKSNFKPKFFEDEDKKYNFSTFIIYLSLYNESPLTKFFIEEDKYKLVFLDTYSLIFVKKSESNKNLINKYEIKQDTFKLNGKEDIETLSKYVLIFDEIGWKSTEIYVYEKLLEKDKNTCLLKNLLKGRPIGDQKLKNSKIKISNTVCN